jgi:hypothetical protein
VEWFGEYADASVFGYFRMGVKGLAASQDVIARGLGNMAGVLRARKPTVRKVVFKVQVWGLEEADQLWRDSMSQEGKGLRKTIQQFRDVGIEFTVEGVV